MTELLIFFAWFICSIAFAAIVKKIHSYTRKEQALFLMEVWANKGENK